MSSPLWKRLQLLASVLTVLAVVAVLVAAWGWWRMRRTLPQLDGTARVAGLGAPVRVTRDALGVPTIRGATREDVARALGFLHAQDRFFQMDLTRRSGAGELAELFGPAAVGLDQMHRLHGFRRTAERALAALPASERALLDAYTAGVNAGLAALPAKPWEYVLLRADARPWQPVDSMLAIYAMWFDLQDASARVELSQQALRESMNTKGYEFLSPRGTAWEAALDGSTFPVPPLPDFSLRPTETSKPAASAVATPDEFLPGSNCLALGGAHTATGAGMIENDMHLTLSQPPTWYRAVMEWPGADSAAPHRLVGVTLPGTPTLVAGSNGQIAWGYTNSYVDNIDVVSIETDEVAHAFYRTAQGYREIENRAERIAVRGGEAQEFIARWTEWGPIFHQTSDGRLQALRWTAHDPENTNLTITELETATTVAEAVAIAHRAGMPNENLLVADRAGGVAWTLTGRLPRRAGYDGRVPVSWAYGDRKWEGWVAPDEIPTVLNPAEGILWSGNQRMVGGDAYAVVRDNGYDDGPRARQLRDDLRALVASGRKAEPADLLAIALDDRAVFLRGWHELLLATLTDEAVAGHASRAEVREAIRNWDGRASAESAAYRLVQAFRAHAGDLALEPLLARARQKYPVFYLKGLHTEDAAWRLLHEQPARLLNPRFASWNALLLEAVDGVVADIDHTGLGPRHFTNGRDNALKMQHPFSRVLPRFVGRWLDLPEQPLPGGNNLPRVQGASFGASERMVVSPGHEEQGIFHMPGGQSGHPMSPFYRAGHAAWVEGQPTPLLPGPTVHTLTLTP